MHEGDGSPSKVIFLYRFSLFRYSFCSFFFRDHVLSAELGELDTAGLPLEEVDRWGAVQLGVLG